MKYINKDIPVLIHNYHSKFLKFNIERLGFNVIEINNSDTYPLGNEVNISIYAVDNCDPKICGHMFSSITKDIKGSMQLDSLCVIYSKDHVLVNTNDCPFNIAKKTLKNVKKRFPNIDFALVGYNNASLFPHCMINYNEEKMKKEILKSKNIGLKSGLNTLQVLKPKFYMPFAGTYII